MTLFKKDYLAFKAGCHQCLADIELPLQVSPEEQAGYMTSVKNLVDGEHFYFVVDLISFELTHGIGLERWFGYSPRPFTMYDYLKTIHPNHVVQLMQMALATLEVTSQKPGLRFMDQRIIACLPMKDQSGRFWWVKRESTTFQLDARGRLTAYANLFTLVKEYDGESMAPRYSDRAGNRENELYTRFVSRYRERIASHLPFTRRQFEILRFYADSPAVTSQQLGDALLLSKQTVDKHNQSILFSARSHFGRTFHSAHEVAAFLKEEKIL